MRFENLFPKRKYVYITMDFSTTSEADNFMTEYSSCELVHIQYTYSDKLDVQLIFVTIRKSYWEWDLFEKKASEV